MTDFVLPRQKLVIENMDILVQMRNNFDKPEEMANLKKRLTGETWREEEDLTERVWVNKGVERVSGESESGLKNSTAVDYRCGKAKKKKNYYFTLNAV